MNLSTALLAAAIGYLLGSISGARLVVRVFAPNQDITQTEVDIPGSEEKLRVGAVSGTTVSIHLGKRFGCLTSVIDILKATVPTLAFKIAYPDTSYFLIAAAMTMVGHNWPLYHGFKGGRGVSTIYGAFLAIDWIGSLVTAFGGMFLGMVIFRDMLISFLAGLWLMIPWLWFRTHDVAHVVYAIGVNLLFLVAMIPDIKQVLELKRKGVGDDLSVAMEVTPMGQSMKQIANRFRSLKKGEP